MLNSCDWSFVNNEEINVVADTIAKHIITATSTSIPNKHVTIRPNDIPWMNNTIRTLIKRRQKLHKMAKRQNTRFLVKIQKGEKRSNKIYENQSKSITKNLLTKLTQVMSLQKNGSTLQNN